MKPRSIKTLIISCATVLLFAGCSTTKNYKPLEATDIASMIQDRSFVFVAEKMNPLRGPQRNLNAYYDLSVSSDTLHSFLPYYGRAFVAPIDPSRGGLRFDSYEFRYESAHEQGKWNVTIKPKDVNNITTLNFTIFDNGNTTLNVTSMNLDPISFTGHLKKIE